MEFSTYGDFDDIHDAAVEPTASLGAIALWRRLFRGLVEGRKQGWGAAANPGAIHEEGSMQAGHAPLDRLPVLRNYAES